MSEDSLFTTSPQDYGPDYREHLLEQYKLYVEMMDRISSRRDSANNYFLSANTALLGAIGILVDKLPPGTIPWVLAAALAGVLLCGAWFFLVRSYKQLSTGKFKIIHTLETRLPAQLYSAEWEVLKEGKDARVYYPFTHIEIWIPWIFAAMYVVLAAWRILA